YLLRTRAFSNDGNAKFSKQDLIVSSQQHALRLDIAMDQFLCMDILKSIGHLLDIRDNNFQGYPCPFRMALPQGTVGCILHDEKGDAIFYPKLEDTDDMGMCESSHCARLGAEFFTLRTCKPGM